MADREVQARRRGRLLDMLVSDVPGVGWPPLFSSKKATTIACIQQFEHSQWLDPEMLAARQRAQLVFIAAYFERHDPAFAERLAGAAQTAAKLRERGALETLPPLTRQELQSGYGTPLAPLPDGHGPTAPARSSGSTGEPVEVQRTAVNRLHWHALTMRYHDWAEDDFFGRICAVRANLRTFGHTKDWGTPAGQLTKTGPGLLIDIQTDIREQLKQIHAFRPTSLMIYPSNLTALLDELDSFGLDFPGLKVVRTMGETLSPELRERIGGMLGARVHDSYSTEEVGYISMQCPESELQHVMSETLLVEVVDEAGRACAEGEVGRVLVTDLHNYAMPIFRYDVGDFAEVGPRCGCGRGLPTLRRIAGRERNLIVKPDGTRHWPVVGLKGYRAIAPIRQFQLRQHAPERIEFRLVTERPLTEAEEAALKEHLRAVFGYPAEVEITYFEGRLPTQPNGKFEEFVRLF
jgi:phenylacetate-CoA ligase